MLTKATLNSTMPSSTCLHCPAFVPQLLSMNTSNTWFKSIFSAVFVCAATVWTACVVVPLSAGAVLLCHLFHFGRCLPLLGLAPLGLLILGALCTAVWAAHALRDDLFLQMGLAIALLSVPLGPLLNAFVGGSVVAIWLPPAVASLAVPLWALLRRHARVLSDPGLGHWECVVRVTDPDEIAEVRALVLDKTRAHKYNFGVALYDDSVVYRVENEALSQRLHAFGEETRSYKTFVSPEPRRLFHGTSVHAARAIVREGFRLPKRAGMFGRGIYFADSALKSLQYCDQYGLILVCDVDLGKTRTLTSAKNSFDPEQDLSRHPILATLGMARYDSVTAADGFFGAVRVPEYIVYAPEQAAPRYVVRIRKMQKR